MAPDPSDQAFDADDGGPSDGESSRTADEETYERFLYCYVGDLRLAIPVEDVKTITKKSNDVTRIPRSPGAVEGVTDIRGEITALVDPRTYFPDCGDAAIEPAVLVLDRPTDEQAAAVVVDDVVGVETVPESDVFDADEFDEEEIADSALEHPLIVGLVKRTWRSHDAMRATIAAQTEERAREREGFSPADALGLDADDDPGAADDPTADRVGAGDVMGVEVDEFTLDEDEDADPFDEPGEVPDVDAPDAGAADGSSSGLDDGFPVGEEDDANEGSDDAEDVEMDVTPLVAIDRLLRAAETSEDRAADGR